MLRDTRVPLDATTICHAELSCLDQDSHLQYAKTIGADRAVLDINSPAVNQILVQDPAGNIYNASEFGIDRITTIDDMQFRITAPTPSHQEGKIFYDDANHSLAYYNDNSDVTIQVGQETVIRVRNNTGSTIPNGSPVYISGAIGNRPTIAMAKADNEATSKVVGLVTHDVDNNVDGYVTVRGLVRDVNTTAFIEGDDLYLSETVSGGFTTTIPTEPNARVFIGTVTLSGVDGAILVNPRVGYKLEDLNDVNGVPAQNDDFLVFDGTTQVWNASNAVDQVISKYGSVVTEPTGFLNTTDSAISFNDITEELTIVGNYSYYIHGTKYSINGSRSLSVAGEGINYFYLDTNKQLNVTQIFDVEVLLRDNAYVSVVYWNSTDSKHVYLGEERHGILWDWNLHSYHHLTEGTKFQQGLGITDATAFSSIEHIFNADTTLWAFSIIATNPNDFVISAAQNHTTGGTFSLDFSGSEDGDICQFYNGSDFLLDEYDAFTGWIYITSWGPGDNILFYGWDVVTDTIVGNTVNLSNYVVEATLNTWQQFIIPLSDMGLQGATIDAIRMEMVGAGIGLTDPTGFVDDLAFHTSAAAADSDLMFGVSSGIIRDEDLIHNISEILKGEEKFVVYYRDGVNGVWTHDGTTNVLFKNFVGGSGRVAWNEYTGGSWQQSEVAEDEYTLVHVFATNDKEYPIIGVQSQSTYGDIESARAGVLGDIQSIVTGTLPFAEFLPIASFIIITSTDISNSYLASFVYTTSDQDIYQDFRGIKGASVGNISINDHGNLSGLSDDDHMQYFNQVRGDARYLQIGDVKFGNSSTYVADDSTSSTSSVVYQDKLSLVIPGLTSGTYRIGYTMEFNAETIGDVEVRLYNETDAVEMRHNSQETNNVNNWFTFSGFAYIDLTGITKTIKLQFRAGSSNCNVRNASIEFWRQS